MTAPGRDQIRSYLPRAEGGPNAFVLGGLVSAGIAIVALAALGPCLPEIWQERALAEDVRTLAYVDLPKDRSLSLGEEAKLRRKVQALARARGFTLALSEVVVAYADTAQDAVSDKFQAFEAPAEIGYTLSITLPLFGIFEYAAVAVRIFGVRAEHPSAEGKEFQK